MISFYRNDRYGGVQSVIENHFKSEKNYVMYNDIGKLELSPNAKSLFDKLEKISLYRINSGSIIAGGRISATGETLNRIIDGFRRHYSLPAIRFTFYKYFYNEKEFTLGTKATQKVFDVVNSKCSLLSCNVIIVYLQESSFWDTDIFSTGYKNFVFNMASSYGFRILDTSEFILKDDRKAYAPMGPHYSVETYNLIATKIAEMVTKDDSE